MTVDVVHSDGVATVTLNRPEKLNALTSEMREAIAAHFHALARDEATRAIILTGAGRGFCGSGDVTTMGDFTPETARERLLQAHRMVLAVANCEKPVIAAVRGPVAGIGWSLALACDRVIASETASFIQVFRNVGLAPDGGAVYFLTQAVGIQRAKEIVSSARRVGPEEALSLGLITDVVPDPELEGFSREACGEYVKNSAVAFAITKKLFKAMFVPTLEAYLDMEVWAQTSCLMTADHREGVSAFLERRSPDFQK